MSRAILLFLPLFLFFGCQPSATEKAIARQLQDYPESRVQDIYKNFCQDNLGPGHLIPDRESARRYLRTELASYREDLDSLRYGTPERMYYPAGDQGNYVRIDLYAVLDSLVDEDSLLDAFVRSANEGKKLTPEEWVNKWNGTAEIIRKKYMDIPGAEEDLRTLDSLMKAGHLIMHHSPAFEDAYRPHYRIVARDIFEKELRPLIDR